MTKQAKTSGGSYALKGYAFQRQAFEQLREIFAFAQMEMPVEAARMPSVSVDIAARSRNGRLILFEAKFTEVSRRLPRSTYLSIAALKAVTDELSIVEPPVVAVLSNADVDDTTRSMFAKSGIPIITLGSDSTETKERLQEAFQEFGIELPETGGQPLSPEAELGYCFLAVPYHPQYEDVREALQRAVLNAGYAPLLADRFLQPGTLLQKTLNLIQHSRVFLADISSGRPNVLFEMGMASALDKNVIVISKDENLLPTMLQSVEVLLYEDTPEGLKRLQSLLTEALVKIHRKHS